MNGGGDPRSHSPGIASLANLGNTCFLNSVLYTLRFTPGFCHALHHLHQDLLDTRPARDSDQECLLDVIQTLHHLFQKLCSSDSDFGSLESNSSCREPVLPSALLHSIGRLCPLFEGNQQQDAHELLVTLLNSLQDVKVPDPVSATSVQSLPGEGKKLSKKKPELAHNGLSKLSLTEEVAAVNFFKENFVGIGVMRTKCLECEASTYTKEQFTNIDIPILGAGEQEQDEMEQGGPHFFTSQILASETLRDVNKYWCSECRRLNEAQRSVSYEVLPIVLILQLKRFTTVASKTYVSKLTDFIPTPFTLECFCEECNQTTQPGASKHRYRLYAVILHLGASLASGHYIAYVRAGTETSMDYLQCKRPGFLGPDHPSSKSGGKKRGLFKMFSKSSSLPVEAPVVRGEQVGNGGANGSSVCPSLSCCGLKSMQGPPVNNMYSNGDRDRESGSQSLVNGRASPAAMAVPHESPEELWLECDDEQISVISKRELSDILTKRQSTTTPYLLFYHRI